MSERSPGGSFPFVPTARSSRGKSTGPPADWGQLVQAHDDRDVFQASPDELPIIDIHGL